MENQGTNEDDSQSDPHPETGIFRDQTTKNLGPKDCRDMVTGATGEIRHCRDMVTGIQGEIRHRPDMVTAATEKNRNGHDMVTAVQEEIPHCTSGISSGKKKKARSTSQPQFRSEKTLRQLKQTIFCWSFNNWRRAVILPMSITTVTNFQNCLNLSRQQCPPSTGKQRNLNCLKIYSKQV